MKQVLVRSESSASLCVFNRTSDSVTSVREAILVDNLEATDLL